MNDQRIIRVAIDGPSGAGKSTLARSAATELGYLYVDTGAIYRTIGCAARRRGIDPKNAETVAALLPELRVELTYGDDGLQHMALNGEDVTAEIREPESAGLARLRHYRDTPVTEIRWLLGLSGSSRLEISV